MTKSTLASRRAGLVPALVVVALLVLQLIAAADASMHHYRAAQRAGVTFITDKQALIDDTPRLKAVDS
ncbi:hypothetical protein GGF32_002449 [Allomyces javanicus]|nr:hypothetical protein GGF32_002449 [Allomyces javanicus]